MTFIIILEICLLLLSTYTIANCVSTVQYDYCSSDQTSISVIHENVTQEYSSLEEAVDHFIAMIQNHSLSQVVPTGICLPQGHHRITKQTMFYESSFVLVGTQNTTIECDYDPLPFEEGFDYTWHFNQSRLVHFENISFINCPYPIRLITVQNVTVRNCIFE